MWNIAVPWWELILRSTIVYVFLLVLLRVTGKRQVGQLAPFDLVLLLVLSNAVQNAMNAGDNSLIGGLIAGATLMMAAGIPRAWRVTLFAPLLVAALGFFQARDKT